MTGRLRLLFLCSALLITISPSALGRGDDPPEPRTRAYAAVLPEEISTGKPTGRPVIGDREVEPELVVIPETTPASPKPKLRTKSLIGVGRKEENEEEEDTLAAKPSVSRRRRRGGRKRKPVVQAEEEEKQTAPIKTKPVSKTTSKSRVSKKDAGLDLDDEQEEEEVETVDSPVAKRGNVDLDGIDSGTDAEETTDGEEIVATSSGAVDSDVRFATNGLGASDSEETYDPTGQTEAESRARNATNGLAEADSEEEFATNGLPESLLEPKESSATNGDSADQKAALESDSEKDSGSRTAVNGEETEKKTAIRFGSKLTRPPRSKPKIESKFDAIPETDEPAPESGSKAKKSGASKVEGKKTAEKKPGKSTKNSGASDGPKPNIILMMADDLGYNDLGVTGNPDVETPHINSLGWNGVQFKSAYANPICAPTRAQLLTGRHFLRTGVWGVHGARDYLNLDEVTFANRLKAAGYSTGMFGKWHSGFAEGYVPWDRGFDEACMMDLYDYFDNDAICNGKKRFAKGWTVEKVFDWSIDFMERKKDDPFMLYIPLMTPHLGKTWYGEGEDWHAPESVIEKYKNKSLSERLSRLYASIDFMDFQVGRLLTRLDDLKLTNDTVVIFLSDNGPTGNYLMSTEEWQRRNPSRMAGIKGEVHDNGIRVPFFVQWKGHYKPAVVEKALISIEDIFPTMMDLAGAGMGDRVIDGKSITPLLKRPYQVSNEWIWRRLYIAEGPPTWTRNHGIYKVFPRWGEDKSLLAWGNGGKFAIREGRWKYINVNGYKTLFDMWEDPTESHSIDDWDLIDAFEEEMADWWNGMVKEPGSFSIPRFLIGQSNDSMIPAMGVAALTNNMNVRSHSVDGWADGETELTYKVAVKRAGHYDVHITSWGGFQGRIGVEVSCDGESYASGPVSLEGFFARLYVPGEGWGCHLKLKIESGAGWMGFSALRFSHVAG
ncbi:hypothetical protein BSKO_05173 [Bryopsis sp. KO-2023]|nr:hypothetical protein BSKO_05173 [Bryopsis sp. KO-2023]